MKQMVSIHLIPFKVSGTSPPTCLWILSNRHPLHQLSIAAKQITLKFSCSGQQTLDISQLLWVTMRALSWGCSEGVSGGLYSSRGWRIHFPDGSFPGLLAYHVTLATELLECPSNMVAASPKVSGLRQKTKQKFAAPLGPILQSMPLFPLHCIC